MSVEEKAMPVEEFCQSVLVNVLPVIDPNREGICIDVGVGTFAFYCEIFARLRFNSIAVEPRPVNNLRETCDRDHITLVETCISDVNGIQNLYIATYEGQDNLNFSSLVQDGGGSSAKTIQVESMTLAKLLDRINAKKITCLKLDVEGSESNIIRQFAQLPLALMPSVVMFKYGGGDTQKSGNKGWSDKFIKATLDCLNVLKKCGYNFSLAIDEMQGISKSIFYLQELEDINLEHILDDGAIYGNIICFQTCSEQVMEIAKKYLPVNTMAQKKEETSIFLTVSQREHLIARVLGETKEMLDLQALCVQHSIIPRGVIHVGAHEGQEIELYQSMGFQKILLIEANPSVFKTLQKKIDGFPNVQAVNCAISNENGTVTLHLTLLDHSSSILPLKDTLKIYPEIKEIGQINVQAKTLDTLLEELQLDPSEFNILSIDIQGAELLAFQGATNTLKYIDAINAEVNYQELYEGGGLIAQVDEFLRLYGFERVAITTPYHPSWGDAFYVKTGITMSTLGENIMV
ncbi:FkbM family methyltransferase [Microcoleus sp. MON1_C5]|uniref:FkbM family methyltransferase n=1 Tax=Microcoleus sp. MON1_C5 TaxID=2818828 RepID=UPI002FD54669